MKPLLSVLLLLTCSSTLQAQGDNYVLFSGTGDTLITRTSCFCKKKDTLGSTFVVLKNEKSGLTLISVFVVEEPGKNSIPCADFALVSNDTLHKYQLYTPGKLGVYPRKKMRIKSHILFLEKAESNKEGFVYKRTIRYRFKVGLKTFHTEFLVDYTNDKHADIHPPRITKVFGNRSIDRYFLKIITESQYINPTNGKKHSINTHKNIIK
jgi:hypothetical protein